MKIEEFAKHPYTFSHLNQKFVLSWVIEEFDSGLEDMFALEVNGTPLSKLDYLDPSFKLVDEKAAIFDGYIFLNDNEDDPVNQGSFEWRPAVLSHMITEALDGDELTGIALGYFQHSASLTNEVLGVISRLLTEKEGLKTLAFGVIMKMEEKLSDTAVDQFVQHCKHLEKL